MGAVFDAVGGVVKVAAAAVTQGVEGTVAKQAAEGLGVCTGVARVVLAKPILKEIIVLFCHKEPPS